jgi:ATP-dependent Zn protease
MAKRRLRHPPRKSTAYHEAGHAVIARVLTLASGPATIKPDYDEGTAGFSITDVKRLRRRMGEARQGA